MLTQRHRLVLRSAMILAAVCLPASSTDLLARPTLDESTYSCVLCHSEVKAKYFRGIHYKRGIACDVCHGGDPKNFEVEGAKAAGTGYRGKLSKAEGVRLCASCHSNEEMMRQYGLSTDQYQQYRTSKHGHLLLEEGNTDAAACVDCHGVHEILPPADPASKVFRKNLPGTCAACHSDAEYMKDYPIPTSQYDDYIHSVHGRELIENSNRAVPECARCHGVHGARAPGTTEVYNVCGQCHPFIREQFMKSAHYEAEKAGLIKGCEACHGNHRIVRADTEMYTRVCVDCHATDSEAYARGTEIKNLIDEAWERFGEAESEMEQATSEGLWVTDEELIMEEARTLLIDLRTAQHTMDLGEIKDESSRAVSMMNGVVMTLEHKLVSVRIYKLVLIPVWMFVLGMVALFYTELKRARGGGGTKARTGSSGSR